MSYQNPSHRYLQHLDTTILQINGVIGRSNNALSDSAANAEDVRKYFSELSAVERRLDSWSHSQMPEWQPKTLDLSQTPSQCCSGSLELWPGKIDTFYDREHCYTSDLLAD